MKLKTNKAIAKRIKTTKGKKKKIRIGGQDHFNAKESGNTRRNKRGSKILSKSNVKSIRKLTPYA